MTEERLTTFVTEKVAKLKEKVTFLSLFGHLLAVAVSLFLSILLLSSFSDLPCSFVRFAFSKDFKGSTKRRKPCFFQGFPCSVATKQGLEGQGLVAAFVWISIQRMPITM